MCPMKVAKAYDGNHFSYPPLAEGSRSKGPEVEAKEIMEITHSKLDSAESSHWVSLVAIILFLDRHLTVHDKCLIGSTKG